MCQSHLQCLYNDDFIYSFSDFKSSLVFKHSLSMSIISFLMYYIIEPVDEISNNAVCATSKASDQPAHMRSLIRAFASRLRIL